VIPGKALKELIQNDRVIGAIDQEWGDVVSRLYRSFVEGKIFITKPTTAEMIKIVENTYRDVNIALANEVAVLCEKLGISAWEVIEIANRHPRVHVHNPGPGVGGHCISVDPWFLVEKFPQDANIIHAARKINDSVPARVVDIIGKIVNGKKKPKIVILGLAYKANVDDARESPAIAVVDILKRKHPDFELVLVDPHVRHKDYATVAVEKAFQGADLAVLLTAHDEFKTLNPAEIGVAMAKRVILDTHNVLRAERWVPAGFEIHTLGTATVSSPSKVV
jgi:UDP-N-acetyl-D-mannosaminuronic acid dehydrogenase